MDTNGAGDAFVGGKIFRFFPWVQIWVACLWRSVFFSGFRFKCPSVCCRFPVWTGPRETTGSVREGSTLRRQRHHPTSWLHLPWETRLQLRIDGRLFLKPETLNSSCCTQPCVMVLIICFTNNTSDSCSPIFFPPISVPSIHPHLNCGWMPLYMCLSLCSPLGVTRGATKRHGKMRCHQRNPHNFFFFWTLNGLFCFQGLFFFFNSFSKYFGSDTASAKLHACCEGLCWHKAQEVNSQWRTHTYSKAYRIYH